MSEEPYSFTSNTVNGYSFYGSGIFSNVGLNTITLTGSGTPVANQTDESQFNKHEKNRCPNAMFLKDLDLKQGSFIE